MSDQIYTRQEIISAKRKRLTPRERTVLELILKGMSNKEIAYALNIGLRTAGDHCQAILRKFEVRNKINLVIKVLTEDKI